MEGLFFWFHTIAYTFKLQVVLHIYQCILVCFWCIFYKSKITHEKENIRTSSLCRYIYLFYIGLQNNLFRIRLNRYHLYANRNCLQDSFRIYLCIPVRMSHFRKLWERDAETHLNKVMLLVTFAYKGGSIINIHSNFPSYPVCINSIKTLRCDSLQGIRLVV